MSNPAALPPLRVAMTLTQCWHATPGGTATAALDLAAAIAERGDVRLVGIGPRRGEPQPGFEPPVPIHRLPVPLPWLYDTWNLLGYPAVSRAVGGLDLVHVTAPVVPPDRSVPLVVTLNDLFPLTHPDRFTARGRFVMTRALQRVRERARLVIVPSEATAADARAFGIEAERLRVVPYGVRLPDPAPDPAAVDAARRRLGLPERFVLFVGTLEPRKNLPVVLEAMAALAPSVPDVGLVVVGPDGWGPEGGRSLTRLGDRVVRLGFLPAADLDLVYRAAEVFLYPSLAEGFGLPVLEAMGRGAAVVTSAGTSTAEVAGDAGLLVDPTDADAVAAAVGSILGDSAQRRRLGAAARERAAEFTWAACADATVAAYHEALGRPHGADGERG